MHLDKRKSIATGIFVATLLSLVVVPALAAPASQHYQVASDKNRVQVGGFLRIIATVKQAAPNCAYSVQLTVTGPGGVNANAVTTVNTEAGGNGHSSVPFPSGFSGTANLNTPGTYTVTATFTCGYSYSTAPATATFIVFK